MKPPLGTTGNTGSLWEAFAMTEAQFDPSQYVDLGRFPIHDTPSAEGLEFLARCRAELAETGACNLDGFILPEAVLAMAEEALALAPLAYVKDTRRNAYFTKDDPTLPPDHPIARVLPAQDVAACQRRDPEDRRHPAAL